MRKFFGCLVFGCLVFGFVSPAWASSSFSVEQRNRVHQPLPQDWKQISKAYYFKAAEGVLEQISLEYNQAKAREGYQKKLAYWDRSQKKWIKLATIEEQGYLTAEVNQSRAKIISLEKKERWDNFNQDDFTVLAASAIVVDQDSGQVIYQKNIEEVRPMASLTKIMTALVFLESGTSFDKEVIMSSQDFVYGNYVGLQAGDTVTAGDLFYSMLTASSNVCAYALARSTGMELAEFVDKMNARAEELGLEKTSFNEPSGLDEDNVTTAYEYTLLAKEVLKSWEVLQGTTIKEYNFQTKAGEWLKAKSTNDLVRYGSDLYITGGKTGFTYEAGYCLMLKTKDNDLELISVVMGENSSSARFTDTANLLNWVYNQI